MEDTIREVSELFEKNPELQKYFINIRSFRTWHGRNIHPLAKPTVEELIEKAKRRWKKKNELS